MKREENTMRLTVEPDEARASMAEPVSTAYNYCVSFIDLLGQREAMRDQALMPILTSDEDRGRFQKILNASIGAIYRVQEDAKTILAHSAAVDRRPTKRQFTPEEAAAWEEMTKRK